MDVDSDSDDYSCNEELSELNKLAEVLKNENDNPTKDAAIALTSQCLLPPSIAPQCSTSQGVTLQYSTSNVLMPQLSPSNSSDETSSLSAKSLAALNKIETALSYNKLAEEKIRRLEIELGKRLGECRQKLKVIQDTSRSQGDKNEIFRYINCGRPYFKDHLNFPAPDNKDAILAKTEMYDFSLVISVPGWTVRDKSQFIDMMQKMSVDIRKKEIYDKITELKRKAGNSPDRKVEKQIASLRKQADKFVNCTLAQVALPPHVDYDWDMLANKLNRRHTAQEYQSLWRLFFHPSISKNGWFTPEHTKLQKIASAHRYQDWESIAKKLNTNRTGYQCFVYYRTNMTNTFAGKRWTDEEVALLKRLIDYFKEDNYIPWGKIAAAMENRTKVQIYNKYLRLIEIRKGRFLPEEDAVILNCLERFGPNFRRMANYLPGRSMVQIRARHHVLSKMRVSTVWTIEDDRKLIQIMSNQDTAMNFSTATQYFPGRNRVNIRTRYVTLLKWMKKHPNLDVEHAPRRGARRLNHGQASNTLNSAVEGLKNTLNTEVKIKTGKKRTTKDSPESEIEDAIVALLVNEYVKLYESIKTQQDTQQLVLTQNQIVSYQDFNMANLRKCLIFLSSSLNRHKYTESIYKTKYPGLDHPENDVSLIKVKSYSRKETVKTIKIDETPNIWGLPTLSNRSYVFPPHYATITGSRAIMNHVCSKGNYYETINYNVVVKKNALLKDQLNMLTERFYLLFTWPLLLSNEGPNDINGMRLNKIDSNFVRPPLLPNSPEVTINVHCMKKLKNVEVAEVIDLSNEDSNKDKVTIVEKLQTNEEKIVNTKF